MTDRAYEPADVNPFHQFNTDTETNQPAKPAVNPFHQFNTDRDVAAPEETSATGAFARGAERSLLPAVGSFPAIGAGAELGAAAGAAVGGPFAPITAPIGGLIGGAAGGLAGAATIARVQNWALSQLPDTWKDKLGLSDRQEQIDEGEHPTASFLGGLIPYAITMRPGAAAATALPENATALQRIMAHPVTARLFGGAAMGGMEIGQEAVEDDHISWPKAAIATGFGLVFNRPTRLGEAITELGARPARTAFGIPHPTLAQAADTKIMGAGVTEKVFQGAEEQAPSAAMTAQESARQESVVTQPVPAPDVHTVARQMHPELFGHYDDLLARQTALRDWIDEQGAEAVPSAVQHLAAVDNEIAAVGPEVAAAYRRADEAVNPPATVPERPVSMAAMLAARGEPTAAVQAPPIEQQRQFIAQDVARQLVAAGRPEAEAQATGAVVAARYEARASRFNGALGTPQELYEREGAAIQGAKKPPAPPTAISPPTVPQPPVPTAAEPEPAVTAPPERKARAPRDPNSYSLLEHLTANGGIRSDDPNISDLRQAISADNKFIPGLGMLIRDPKQLSEAARRSGARAPKFLDRARESAVEAGYLRDVGEITRGVSQSTVADLLRAADEELRGNKIYREGYTPKGRAIEPQEIEHERESFLRDIRDKAAELGTTKLTPEEENRAVEIYQKEGVDETDAIIERLALEADAREADASNGRLAHVAAGAQAEGEGIAEAGPAQPSGAVARVGGEGIGTEELAEYFQRKPRDLIAEREAEGQQNLLNAPRATVKEIPTAELVRTWRQYVQAGGDQSIIRALELELHHRPVAEKVAAGYDEALRGRVQQKPMDEGLFGTEKDQKELFQAQESDMARAIRDRDWRKIIELQRELEGMRAAMRDPVTGKIYTSWSHQQAIESVPKDEGDVWGRLHSEWDKRTENSGFVDKAGKFISRDEANKRWAVLTMEDVRDARKGILRQGVAAGKIRMTLPIGREGEKPLMTIMRAADASTAIHEFGHAWLGELMRDSLHPQAPEDVKADAKTVLDWVGAENPNAITRRHHEKFARGFEQYMREGVAPSPQLASVFAKFRDWMLRIYQSLRGLGPEITPQVRQVFDRMLAAEPQRTVIAPERMERPTLADVHEADAAHTEPAEAEPAGDRVLAEAEKFTHDLPGAIQDAHAAPLQAIQAARAEAAAHPATETPTRPTEGAGLQSGGGGPEPVAPGGAGGAEPGAELRGGGNAVPEGRGEPAAGERAEPGTHAGPRDNPLAPRPAAQFGARESPFVDKAGNIRLENLTNEAGVRQAIRDAAAENNDFIGDRQGVVTDGQVLDLAADLGMEGAEKLVKERVIGQAFNAVQIMALRQLLIHSAGEVSAAMKKAAIGTDEDLMAYAAAKDRHRLIQGTVAQATAEAGRALRAFRDISGGKMDPEAIQAATGQTLFQLRQEAKLGATLDSPQKISKFLVDSQKKTFARMILEYWINGLISGPATHATYMIGNTILAAEKAGPETAAAAAIGALRRSLGRQGSTVRIGEVAEQVKAGAGNLGPAVKAALDAFRTGTTTALPGERVGQNILPFAGAELAQGAMLDEAAKLSDAMGTGFGMLRGAWDGIIAGGELLKAGGVEGAPTAGLRYSHLGAIPDIELRGVNLLPLGSAVRLPSRFIAAIHSFFRSVNYSMDKSRLAYRAAMDEGLTGTAFDQRVGDLRQNPSEAMMAQARGEATELTLMGQGGEFTKALSRLTNTPIFGLPIFKFIDPFVHISSNIIEQAIIERTPVGLLSPEIRADLSGKNGTVAADTAAARMLMGTVYAIALGGLAAEGYASGSEPADPRQAAIWRLAGNQAHSVRIGDMWYDVHRLGPMGMLLGIASDLYDVAHVASTGDMLTAASHLQHAITQNILDESFMRGPSDLIKAIDDPGRYGEAYLRNWASSFLPYSVGMAQMARASDPYSRQARTVMDSIKAKIPGMSEQLLPRRDIWGEPMPSRDALLAAGVTAIYETRMSRDPVNLALLDLGVYPAMVQRKIRNVQLTDDQYDDFQRIAGRMTKMRLDAIVNSPDFRTWPNHIRHDVISEVITQSREAARGIMMAKYPSIVRDATALRLKKVQGD